MTKNELHVRIFFLVIVISVAILLAFRPIPSAYSPNDTGRYLDHFNKQSTEPLFQPNEADISYLLFNTILRPISIFENDRVFMFVTALIIPLAFFFFGKWGRAGLLWSLAAVFSIIGFELATNALRQAMGLFFLLFSIKLILDGKNISGLIAGGFAMAFHLSNIAFFPLLLLYIWSNKKTEKQQTHRYKNILRIALPIAISVVIFILVAISSVWITIIDFLTLRQTFYVETLSPAFIIFFSLPILYVYIIRKIFTASKIPINETITVIYSTVLIFASLIFFPTIAYRFTFTSFILQIFMALAANNSNNKQGFYILAGMIFQLILYFIMSPYPMEVLFG